MMHQICEECRVYVVASECKICAVCLDKTQLPWDLPRTIHEVAVDRIAALEKRLRQIDDERDRVAQEIHDLRQWGE